MHSMPKSGLAVDAFLDRWVYLCLLVLLASLCFSTALMEISFVAALIGWVILKTKKGWSVPCDKKMFWALAAFVSLSSISFFWSEFPKQSFRGILKVLKQFLVFWMVAESFQTTGRQQTAFQTLSYLFIFLGLDGAWQYVFGTDLIRRIPFESASSGPRISASLHNYGLLAAFVLTFWPLLFSRLEKRGGLAFLFRSSLGVVLGLLLLFWTRLRGAWLAFLGGVIFFLWNQKKKLYLVLLFCAATEAILLLPRSMVIHLDAERKEQSLVERFYLWDRAAEVIRARPWTGTGINTYAVAHQKYDRRQNWRVKNYYAHNGYLQMAAETGLPSLACFLTFLFFYFRKAFGFLKGATNEEEKRTLVGILTGLVNFLILSLIDTILHNPQSVMGFWFLAGWGMAYSNLFPEELKRGERHRPLFSPQ